MMAPRRTVQTPQLERHGLDGAARRFRVVREGMFGGHFYNLGDIVVCRGKARPGDATVLVARGNGRPRMGRLIGTRLVGDAGEPCHPVRWMSAGRVEPVGPAWPTLPFASSIAA